MKEGDYVLFYSKGLFYYSARVVLTKHSAELGKVLWPVDEDGEPWTCLFFVDNLEKVEIPIRVVQELAEYEPTWDRVQGFMRLNDEGKNAIIEKFGSIETFLSQKPEVYKAISKSIESIIEKTKDESLEDEKDEIIDKNQILLEARAYVDSGTSHSVSLTPHRVRVENKQQKKRIAELENYSCQVCGWALEWVDAKGKERFRIDIDHINEKSKGGGEDLHNLWALCPNCHVKKTFNILKIDLRNKRVYENGSEIKLHHDFHLFV